MFLAVYLERSPQVCKVICQGEFLAECLVVWEVGCLGDQVDLAPNNFHPTLVQDLAQCKGFRINHIHPTQAIHNFNHPDRKECPRRLEWVIQG